MHKLISDKNEREKRVLELMREVGLDIQHVTVSLMNFQVVKDSVSMWPERWP